MTTPICPYCGKPSEYLPDSRVYARSYGGYVYACLPCDAFVGCHKQGDHRKSKGTLADQGLRDLRKRAHALFDPMWKMYEKSRNLKRHQARNIAYNWLAKEMGMTVDQCHIGMLRDDDVKRIIQICEAVYAKSPDFPQSLS